MKRWFVRHLGLLAVFVVGIGVAVGVNQLSAHNAPITAGVIHACAKLQGESGLRLVAANEACKSNEVAVDWSKGVALCPSGQVLQSLNGDGTATCKTDNDTTYTAGAGLKLNGATFSADTNTLQARVTGACGDGSSIKSIDVTGQVACAADTVGFRSVQVVSITPTILGGATGVQPFEAACPDNTKLIAGGFALNSIHMEVLHSLPVGNSWRVLVTNARNTGDVTVHATCMS